MGLGIGGVCHGRPVAVDGRDLSLYEEFAFGRGLALDEFDVVVSTAPNDEFALGLGTGLRPSTSLATKYSAVHDKIHVYSWL